MSFRRVSFALLLVTGGLVRAQPTAQELYEAGVALQRQAEQAGAAAASTDLLRKSVEQFEVATKLQPGFCAALREWAVSLGLLSERVASREEHARLTQAARERFAYAADCKNVDITVFETWAMFLMNRIQTATDLPGVRHSMLMEAKEALEKGLKLANTDDAVRARLESNLGQCLDWVALQSVDAVERPALLKEAIAHFESAARLSPATSTRELFVNWGLALLRLGVETHDRAALTQALQRLQTGLKQIPDPKSEAARSTHYNLACVHAALEQPDEAFRQLRFCLDNDPRGEWLAMANQDPDLEPVRRLDGYQQLAKLHVPPPTAEPRPEQTTADRARTVFLDALELQRRADFAGQTSLKLELYRQAAEKHKAATELDANVCEAHRLWAGCLVLLETLTTNRTEKTQLRQAACERFAAATRCPEADAEAYYDWASYLMTGVYPQLTNPAEKLAVLVEARSILEKGLPLAKYSVNTAHLQSQLANCLLLMADNENVAAQKRKLWEAAVGQFEAAAKVDQFSKSPQLNGQWGTTLVKLGSLTKSALVLSQAKDHLQIAFDYNPRDIEVQYNMACMFALLKDAPGAMRHLRAVLKLDQTGQYYAAASKDPDLAFVRTSAEYREVFQFR